MHSSLGRRFVATIPAFVLLASVAACSASAPSVNPTIMGAEFAAKALATCDAAHTMKKAEGPFPFPDFNPTKPDVSKFPVVADYLEKTAATYESWSAAMKALGAPSGAASSWNDLIAAIDKHGSLARDQIDAARKGDSARFTAGYNEGATTQAALLKAAQDAGVPACAAVDR